MRGPLREILVCHCVECRRSAGHAWTATAARHADLETRERGDLAWIPKPRSQYRTSWERPPEGIPTYPRGYPDDAPRLDWG